MNPHASASIWTSRDESGARGELGAGRWGASTGSCEGRLDADALKIGDVVTVEGGRAKNGTNLANARVVTLASTGQRLFAASSQGPGEDPNKK